MSDEPFDPLFDWGAARNQSESQRRRDEGTERVREHTDQYWRIAYWHLMEIQAPGLGEPFKGEDFRAYASPRIGEPHHPHSWGGHWLAADKGGWATKVEGASVNRLTNPRNHACTRPLWRWADQRPVKKVKGSRRRLTG
jgi:hypothetical protein